MSDNIFYNQGWQCPVCKRVMSPTYPFCPCNGQGYKTITTDGTNIKINEDAAFEEQTTKNKRDVL